jgi:hypothetical protein
VSAPDAFAKTDQLDAATLDQPDTAKARADDAALLGAVAANPRVMGQMPRLLRAAGFELLMSFAYVLALARKV